jgi:hypothetical protein
MKQWVEWAGTHADVVPNVAISMGTGDEDFKKARFLLLYVESECFGSDTIPCFFLPWS